MVIAICFKCAFRAVRKLGGFPPLCHPTCHRTQAQPQTLPQPPGPPPQK